MLPREDSKKSKSKVNPHDEFCSLLETPNRKEVQAFKCLNLRDLSPYSPIVRTLKKSLNATYDLAMIESPTVPKQKRNFVDDMFNISPQICQMIHWDEEEDSPSLEESSSYDEMSSSHISNQQEEEIKVDPTFCQNAQPDLDRRANSGDLHKPTYQNQKNRKLILEPRDTTKSKPNTKTKKITCNCKKTQCLKLYCDCFRENQVCGEECNCYGCHNTPDNEIERHNAMLTLMERNPEAFKPKLEAEQHAKGCNCKKSGCLKKYCECYQAGLSCGEHCRCEGCKNCGEKYDTKIIAERKSYLSDPKEGLLIKR